jgi:hypothetical protein
MKILLDIPDDKATSLIEVLNSIPYIKTQTLTDEKALLIEEIKESITNLNLVRKGKLKAIEAKNLLNEL